MFISRNTLICCKSIHLKWVPLEIWLFLKLWGYVYHSFILKYLQVSDSCGTSNQLICSVSQGRIKHIHENMPKNAIEPTPKFDCHLSKSANRVTSLLSYRAFELTQVSMFFFINLLHVLCIFVSIFVLIWLSWCLSAIFFRVCIRWDQGTAQACVPLRCGFLSVQRQGGCCISNDCTQVCIPAGNGETQQAFSGSWGGLCDAFNISPAFCLFFSLTGLTLFPLKEVEVKTLFNLHWWNLMNI